MATKTPLSIMKEKFGEKSKLVEALKGFMTEDLWLGRQSSDRGGDRGLQNISNSKLLRLHATFSTVKEKFGTRGKLIDAILEAQNRVKDAGYKSRLEAYPVPRLYDLYKSTAKRASSSKDAKTEPKAKAKAAPADAPAKAKKAPAKAKK